LLGKPRKGIWLTENDSLGRTGTENWVWELDWIGTLKIESVPKIGVEDGTSWASTSILTNPIQTLTNPSSGNTGG